MALPCVDSFNRIDSATPGNLDTGQSWSVLSGTWFITSNQLDPNNGAHMVVDMGSVPTNYSIQATLTAVNTSSDCAIQFRHSGTGNANRWRLDITTTTFVLQKIVASTLTTIATINQVRNAGDVIRIDVFGNVITVYVNNVAITTTTDSALASNSFVGFQNGSTTTVMWDDFSARSVALGTGASTIPHFGAALAGTSKDLGVMSGTIPHFTSSFGGSVTAATSVTGDIASTIPHFGSSLAGTSKNLGSIASTTPSFGGTLAGTNDDVGTLGVTVPSFGSAFEGDTKDLGSVATTMPSFTSAVDGTVADVSTIDATMPRFGSALEGTVTNVGSMATTIPSFNTALVGDELIPVEAEVEIWMPHFGTALQGYSPPTAQLEITMPSFGSMIVGEGGGEPMPEASGGGGYWDLIAILSNAARIAEQDLARLDATPTDCPKCGTVLKASRDGVRFCPFDGWKQTEGYHIENPG